MIAGEEFGLHDFVTHDQATIRLLAVGRGYVPKRIGVRK
jgi:hypothetical protein